MTGSFFTMDFLSLFCLTSLISFAGSCQAGLVNVAVIKQSLSGNRTQALWLALGGSLPEALYAFLAVKAGYLVMDNPQLFHWIEWLVVPLFLLAALYYLRPVLPQLAVPGKKEVTSQSSSLGFLKGFLLGMANLQLFPYWLGVFLYINTTFTPPIEEWAFIAGTSTGAFGLLCLLIELAHRQRSRIYRWFNKQQLDRIVGGLFLLLALGKLISLLLSL
jgi:threonine/homoserine/homoserine lactone efflux protein